MVALFASGRAAVAILLLLTLPFATCSNRATWPRCKHGFDGRGRVLEPEDNDVIILNLENCNITTLSYDDFNTTAPKLEEIHLNRNQLEEIDPAVFTPMSHITWLFLSENKLREIPNFGAHSLFPNLQGLYLDSNRISVINDTRIFSACVNLEDIYLDDNQIEHISKDVFKSLVNLESISLSSNKIKIITDSVFNINTLTSISLDDNLIEYISPNAFSNVRNLYLHKNRLSFLPTNYALIFSPAPKGYRASWTIFHENPWQCGCLLELMAVMRRAKSGVKYAAWEYNGKLRSCEFSGRVACNRTYNLLD